MCFSLRMLTVCFALLVLGVACEGERSDEAISLSPPATPEFTAFPCVTLDVDEARERASFNVVAPADLPAALKLESIMLSRDGDTTSCEDADNVEFVYRVSESSSSQRVRLIERTYAVRTGDIESAIVIKVDGESVRRVTTSTVAGDEITLYEWEHEMIYFQVVNPARSGVSEEVINELITGVLESTRQG